ncbi:mammalian ependymin-related protein 1 [Plakobranchus ocellatus]|uniref:Mammalian ependymin-related protein 1 n=1 Tax=Plakobranchus ocellatus TaxID=259542 RepID=A0AAV4ACG1_9GAST|nr:mammalian ependymin-related protein 1 [Plakobranchus ocellatus]
MVYDEDNKRISEFEDETVNKTRTYYFKVKLYNENKEYILDLKTRKCNVTTPHPWHPYGVPPDAEFKAEAVVGAAGIPGESVTIADFAATSSDGDFGVAVTEPSCFPVGHAFYSKDRGLEITNFYDMQNGITDPEAFKIPKECTSL